MIRSPHENGIPYSGNRAILVQLLVGSSEERRMIYFVNR